MAKTISEILHKYYDEAVGGMVQKAPSTLNRGEGTDIDYYIYKIDLVGSTPFTKDKTHKTYLKLAHTFLSAVDEITRVFGAEEAQTEYAGDSVIAYFRVNGVEPISVLKSAYYCRLAATAMRYLDTAFKEYFFVTKTIIHCGNLIMANIGPSGKAMVAAIGPELHKACKMEERVGPGEGKASIEFMKQLPVGQKHLLKGNYREEPKSYLQSIIPEPRALTLGDMLPGTRTLLDVEPSPLNSLLAKALNPPTTLLFHFTAQRELIDYSIQWDLVKKFIGA